MYGVESTGENRLMSTLGKDISALLPLRDVAVITAKKDQS